MADDIKLFVSTEEFDVVSAVIRWYTTCSWSHAGFIRLSDRFTFSAMFEGGVKWRAPNPKAKILILNYASVEAAFEWALTQICESYDWTDILGIATGRNWERSKEWICDKLVFAACVQANDPLLNHTFIPLEHLTPAHILTSLKVSEYQDSTAV